MMAFIFKRRYAKHWDGKTLSYCTICCAGLYRICPILSWESWGEGRDEFAGADRYDAVYAVDVLKQFCNDNIHVFGFREVVLWLCGQPF